MRRTPAFLGQRLSSESLIQSPMSRSALGYRPSRMPYTMLRRDLRTKLPLRMRPAPQSSIDRKPHPMNAFVRPAKHTFVAIDEINLSHTIRPYNSSVVAELAQSIRAIGLQTPLTCIVRDGQHVFVSGRNRLEALRVIGCEQAPVRIVDFDDVDAQLWQLSENLHRAELTKLEYDRQVVRYADS